MNIYRIHVEGYKSYLVAAESFCDAVRLFSEWEIGIYKMRSYDVKSVEFVGKAVAAQQGGKEGG